MPATSQNVLFPCHNHTLTMGTDNPLLTGDRAIIEVSGYQYWWLASGYDLDIGYFQKWLAWWLSCHRWIVVFFFCAVVTLTVTVCFMKLYFVNGNVFVRIVFCSNEVGFYLWMHWEIKKFPVLLFIGLRTFSLPPDWCRTESENRHLLEDNEKFPKSVEGSDSQGLYICSLHSVVIERMSSKFQVWYKIIVYSRANWTKPQLRSEGLGFDSHCWSCVEVSGKLRIPCCFCPPSSNGYLPSGGETV